MRIELPKIDEREFSRLLDQLKTLIPHYAPEWTGFEKDGPGGALLKIFSRMAEGVIHRMNRVPLKNFAAFLDMLGIKQLAAQPSRVPVTFKLAKGTDKELFIPERTQSATDKTLEHEELPFETENNLQATPSLLKKVFSIDPENDTIYIPPPGFLDQEERKKGQVTYKIVSSPSAGSRDFQLDHATDLQPGDFLAIGDKEKEYGVISKISGMIIYITDRLLHDYPSDTSVEKLTVFKLFEGKNMQEHVLYVGHKDFFNVKGTAEFTLFINHRADTGAGLNPLRLSWDYWGEVEGEEGEGWRTFEVIDGTSGLSTNGTVELNKKTNGEITEKEINSVKSRWIRAILKEPLAIGISRVLPALDNIVFNVKSSGKDLLPDLTFYNETPLDITKAYYPFGNEPRIFDIFSIASKEAFSKKGAKIEIEVEVEPRGVLGTPAAIEYNGKIKVFARGTYGRLIEVEIDSTGGDDPKWSDHGFPMNSRMSSAPSAVAGKSGMISIFVRAENGRLAERLFNGMQWQWIDRGMPKDSVKISYDPHAVVDPSWVTDLSPFISVFVTGEDGELYGFHHYAAPSNTSSGQWANYGKPSGISAVSLPFAYKDSSSGAITVFVKGIDGKLYVYNQGIYGTGSWDEYGDQGTPSSTVKVDSRPFGTVNASGELTAYVKGDDGNLWEFRRYAEGPVIEISASPSPAFGKVLKWLNIDDDGPMVDSDPHGVIPLSGSTHIFVRDKSGLLWEFSRTSMSDGSWTQHSSPPNANLSFSPFVLSTERNMYVYSASEQKSIIERVSASAGGVWNQYKDPNETALTPSLSWEYWNEKGWMVLKGLKDGTSNLLNSGKISFDLPEDIDETTVAGQKSYWIRTRIVGGDYGKESFELSQTREMKTVAQQIISSKNSIKPPVVDKLTITYSLERSQDPQQCITYNNLEYLDQTDASKTEDKFFSPYVQLEDQSKTLYLGFDKTLKGGPINIFFVADELPFSEEKKPKLEWTYSREDDWNELQGSLDSTEGLIKSDILEIIGPLDFFARSRFGEYLFWLRGSLAKGEFEGSPVLHGIYPNTTWSTQAETIRDEVLGSSNGEPGQTFSFLRFPVLEGEEIRVREILSEEEKQDLLDRIGNDAIYEIKDEKGKVIETWLSWSEVPDFFDSSDRSRHYTLDRAVGKLQFGDGGNGMIPPFADNNIKAFAYQTGGGSPGNVKAGEIKTLKTTVPGVDKVSNPAAADGGADAATLEEMLEIGPAMVSTGNRAVTVEDFEWLARQASRKVAKAKCLPNTNNTINTDKEQGNELGWVTVLIVPDEKVPEPVPSLELKRKVRKYIEDRCLNTLTQSRHINVDRPFYIKICVSADVYVTSMDKASLVEREFRNMLDAFFHPLTGGPEGAGWDFGRAVSASDVYAVIEDIDGVDHIENLTLSCNGNADKETVEIRRNFLVANGKHTINIHLKKEIEGYESS